MNSAWRLIAILQPRTDAEWNEVRRNAIIVAEASNLLMMEGRRVAKEGKLRVIRAGVARRRRNDGRGGVAI